MSQPPKAADMPMRLPPPRRPTMKFLGPRGWESMREGPEGWERMQDSLTRTLLSMPRIMDNMSASDLIMTLDMIAGEEGSTTPQVLDNIMRAEPGNAKAKVRQAFQRFKEKEHNAADVLATGFRGIRNRARRQTSRNNSTRRRSRRSSPRRDRVKRR